MDAPSDKLFAGSIPELYDTCLVPLIFETPAADLARRVLARSPLRVLEIAAGTGVVTRAMSKLLPVEVEIVATDLNQPMLDRAAAIGTARPVVWRQADAQDLPFEDASFDAVVCQFGAMFFPDKPRAYAEARRVLRPGGAFLFNVWQRIEDNEFADAVTTVLADVFPEDPPRFLARTPHGYHDPNLISSHLALGGFTKAAQFETITARSRAASPSIPAIAYCQGTPLRNEIEARGEPGLAAATERCTDALARRFGSGSIDGKVQFSVITAEAS